MTESQSKDSIGGGLPDEQTFDPMVEFEYERRKTRNRKFIPRIHLNR